MSNVGNKHSQYRWMEPAWQKMADVMEGRRRIIAEGEKYLPKPPALKVVANDPRGEKWAFYRSFARFPDFTKVFRQGVQGLVHRKPPQIELPPRLEHLKERATPDGKSLAKLWQDVTREVFDYGRHGLLPEIVDRKGTLALCQYPAVNILNWRATTAGDGIRAALIVLEEPVEEEGADEFTTDTVTHYRVLRLAPNGQYIEELYRKDAKIASTDNTVKVGRDSRGVEYPIAPSRQGRSFDGIPFVMINAIDLKLRVGPIPMEPLADKALDIYRSTAIYHRTLYAKGDPNIIRTGITKEEAKLADMVGGGTMWSFENPNAKVEYLDIDGQAIPYMRTAMQDDFVEAREQAGRLIDSQQREREAAEALAKREASQQVTTVAVVQNAAHGVRTALRRAAVVVGARPEDVVFEPNLDFAEALMTGSEANALMDAVSKGFPLSEPSLHDIARRGGLTNKSYDEEKQLMDGEDPLSLFPAGNAGDNPRATPAEGPAPANQPARQTGTGGQ